MTDTLPPQNRHGFKLAVLCALRVEAESVRAVFDKCWEDEGRQFGKASGDKNTYTTGVIGQYNVVLLLLSSMGGVPAAHAVASLSSSFPRIQLVFAVGVCGVLPIHPETKEEIVLGDVVVSTAVIQYDYGRMYPGGFERKGTIQDSLRKTPKEVKGFIDKLSMRQNRQRLRTHIKQLVNSEFQSEPTAMYPGAAQDHLYDPTYLHQHRLSTQCTSCRDGLNTTCSRDCDQLGCQKDKLIARKRHHSAHSTESQDIQSSNSPVIHFGCFGSANTVMKSGTDRDRIAAEEGLTAFEMEGTGVWDEHPTIVIKGACDYADSHKNKTWQPYAAMMAAICLKVVLAEWVSADELADHANDVSSYDGHQINSSVMVGTPPGADLSFRGPAGIYLGQAPYIEPGLFIGREPELKQMEEALMPKVQSRQPRRLVLGGMGGVGKTQLVIAFTNRRRDDFTSAFWLNATTQATVEADFQEIARQISATSETDGMSAEKAIAYVHRWLSHSQNTQWLLIFDNYDEPSQYRLQQYYPPASHGAIVITTRRPDRVAGQRIYVKPLPTIEESLKVLVTRSDRKHKRDDPYAKVLAERLAGLPLALATAGAYLQASNLTFQDYHREYEARWNVDPYDSQELTEYQDRTFYTTWSVSFAQLEQERPYAAQMLRLLAYFDNRFISYELLAAGNASELDWLQNVITSEVRFDSIMRILTSYHFIERQQSTQTWSMHNCVHDWTLAALNYDVDAQCYEYALSCVGSSINAENWDFLDCISYDSLASHAARLVHNQIWQHDVIHAIVCRKYNMVYRIASLLRRRNRLTEAEKMYNLALTAHEKAFGPEYIATLDTMHGMFSLYMHQDRLADAELVCERAPAGKERTLGPEHTSTLETVIGLGVLHHRHGRLAEAEKIYKRVLAGNEKAPRLDHTANFMITNNLALVYRIQGKLSEAEQMLEQSLAERQKLFGMEHTSTLHAIGNLGLVYYDQGKLAEAEQMYKRVLSGREQALGMEHESTLGTVGRIAILYHDQGKLAEAEQMYKRALSGREKAFGIEHASTLSTVNNFGVLRHKQGKLAEAEQMYKQALSGKEKALGMEHESTLTTIGNIAILYHDQGKLAEAEQMYKRALSGREKALGLDHPSTQQTKRDLESLYDSQEWLERLG